MGDTLPHLASLSDVSAVLRSAATALAPGGHLLLSFRDYTVARVGSDRFIPVRTAEDRIFTCFLEYGPTHVSVHDLVHTHLAGKWHLAVNSYDKLRLAPAWVVDELAAAGLSLVLHTSENGLVTLAARRTPAS
jgi:hypothetical protein